MMNKYVWRKNFTATFSDNEKSIRGKLAFKTKETEWLDTESPVLVLVSINSSFHALINGDLKMNAFMSVIKSQVKGKVTVLISDRAHLHTDSLKYDNDLKFAFEESLKSANKLIERYRKSFEGCQVAYWHAYITQDREFERSLTHIKCLYKNDPTFKILVLEDVESTYTQVREEQYSDKNLFFDKATEDIFEQCACLMILSQKGYRFQFYPGESFASVEYVNRVIIPPDKKLSWINVFLTIEKKSVI